MRAISSKALGAAVFGAGLVLMAAPAFAQDASTVAPADPAPVAAAESTPAPAPADVPAPTPAPEKADPAFSLHDLTTYGTLGIGGTTGNGSSAPGDAGIFNAQAGVRFNPYFGIEGEYATGLPGDSRAGKKLSLTDRYAAYIVGYLPWTKHLDLFAKLGLGHSRYKYEDNGAAIKSDLDSVNWGVGAQYLFNDHDGVRTEVLKENYHDSHGERTSFMFSWIHRF